MLRYLFSIVLIVAGFSAPIYLYKYNNNELAIFLIPLFSASLALAIWWLNDTKNDKNNNDLTIKKIEKIFRQKYLVSLFLFFSSFSIAVYAAILLFQIINLKFNEIDNVLSAWAALATLAVVLVTAFYLVAIHGTWTEARNLLDKLEKWNKERELENQLWKSKMASLNQVMQNDHDSMSVLATQLHELSITTYERLNFIPESNTKELHKHLNKKTYNFATAVRLLQEIRDIKQTKNYKTDLVSNLNMTLKTIDKIDSNKNLGIVRSTNISTTERMNNKLLPRFYYESLYEYLLEIRSILKEDFSEKELSELNELKKYIEVTHL